MIEHLSTEEAQRASNEALEAILGLKMMHPNVVRTFKFATCERAVSALTAQPPAWSMRSHASTAVCAGSLCRRWVWHRGWPPPSLHTSVHCLCQMCMAPQAGRRHVCCVWHCQGMGQTAAPPAAVQAGLPELTDMGEEAPTVLQHSGHPTSQTKRCEWLSRCLCWPLQANLSELTRLSADGSLTAFQEDSASADGGLTPDLCTASGRKLAPTVMETWILLVGLWCGA